MHDKFNSLQTFWLCRHRFEKCSYMLGFDPTVTRKLTILSTNPIAIARNFLLAFYNIRTTVVELFFVEHFVESKQKGIALEYYFRLLQRHKTICINKNEIQFVSLLKTRQRLNRFCQFWSWNICGTWKLREGLKDKKTCDMEFAGSAS